MKNPQFNPSPGGEASNVISVNFGSGVDSLRYAMPRASGDDENLDPGTENTELHLVPKPEGGEESGGTSTFRASREAAIARHPGAWLAEIVPIDEAREAKSLRSFLEVFKDPGGAGKRRRLQQLNKFLPLIGAPLPSTKISSLSPTHEKVATPATKTILELFDVHGENLYEKPQDYPKLLAFAKKLINEDYQDSPTPGKEHASDRLEKIRGNGRNSQGAAAFLVISWAAYIDLEATRDVMEDEIFSPPKK